MVNTPFFPGPVLLRPDCVLLSQNYFIFTLNIWTPSLLTILVLKFEHFTSRLCLKTTGCVANRVDTDHDTQLQIRRGGGGGGVSINYFSFISPLKLSYIVGAH